MSGKDLKIKTWVLTPHAAQRLAERNVSIEELEVLMTEPEFVSQ